MLRHQEILVKRMKLDVHPADPAGAIAKAILRHLKTRGVPKSSVTRKILSKHGYIKIVNAKWQSLSKKDKLGLLKKYQSTVPKIKVAIPVKNELSACLSMPSFAQALYGKLVRNGNCVVRWHKHEGQLLIEALHGQGHGAKPSWHTPEVLALRAYLNKLKNKYKGGHKYYQAVLKLADDVGIEYKEEKPNGDLYGDIQLNLQVQMKLNYSMNKGNKKLWKIVGYTGK